MGLSGIGNFWMSSLNFQGFQNTRMGDIATIRPTSANSAWIGYWEELTLNTETFFEQVPVDERWTALCAVWACRVPQILQATSPARSIWKLWPMLTCAWSRRGGLCMWPSWARHLYLTLLHSLHPLARWDSSHLSHNSNALHEIILGDQSGSWQGQKESRHTPSCHCWVCKWGLSWKSAAWITPAGRSPIAKPSAWMAEDSGFWAEV